jgi:hypothetical protein
VGGIPGYEEFLRVWNDPKHPEHEEMRQWGESQHYRFFDIGFQMDLQDFLLPPLRYVNGIGNIVLMRQVWHGFVALGRKSHPKVGRKHQV